MDFWENFYFECKKRGTNPNTVGKSLNISSATLTGWKKGSPPNSERLLAIADYFGVSCDYLLGREIQRSAPDLPADQRELLNNYIKADDYGKQQIRALAESESKRNIKPENAKLA